MDLDMIRNFILGVILVSLIAAAGALALTGLQSDVQRTDRSTATNESVTLSSSVGNVAYSSWYVSGSATCYNTTGGGTEVGSPWCNVSSTGQVTTNGAANFSDNTAYLTYTYSTPSSTVNITNSGQEGLGNSTGYFGIAGTIAGVALLLTIVLTAFVFMYKRR